ncbi:PLP-dependent aminotransferase family protein [Bifidobacterium simiarum]|uniref:aminotransferase-like domain-containing protein n=1 Tax=Bifidobacterium simiarum TaxID=2045441 RepID=UPI001BDD95E0|nr:PLP-dependent aminotransferase family protein [Bifidobacterium simiarum]MBT1166656.1 PLP-dependent aminotransferase family protein [Bifidobacterium simiarum]
MPAPIISDLFASLDDKAPFSSGSDTADSKEPSIDFVAGIPDYSLLPRKDFGQAAQELMNSDDSFEALRYSAYEGIPSLRRAVARWRHTDVSNVFITNGATQGIFLSMSALLNPGDTILVENPTFPFALKTFRLFGLQVETVPLTGEGVDLDALESKLQSGRQAGKRYKALYTIPDFHNPASVSLPGERKRALVELAERYDFVIIADSPYRDLWFDHQPGEFPQEQRTAEHDGRLLEVGTFSKTLGPGWRVGWIITDRVRVKQLTSFRRRLDAHPSGVAQSIIAHLLDRPDDWFARQVDYERAAYRRKSELLYSALQDGVGDFARIIKPEGGYFQWLVFDERHDPANPDRAKALAAANVHLVPGDVFYPHDHGSHAARLAFSHLPEADLVEGARRLAEALR